MLNAKLCLDDFSSKIKYALRTPTLNTIESMIENQTGRNYSLDWVSSRMNYNSARGPKLLARLGFRDVEEGVHLKCTITFGDLVIFQVDGLLKNSVISIANVKDLLHSLTDYYKYLLRTKLRTPLPSLTHQDKLMTAFEQLVTF